MDTLLIVFERMLILVLSIVSYFCDDQGVIFAVGEKKHGSVCVYRDIIFVLLQKYI